MARRGFARNALTMAAIVLAACAPRVSIRVPPAALVALPVERQLTILDAESDLLAALDHRESQEDRVLAAESAWRRTADRLREAEDRRDRVESAKQPNEIAEAVVAEARTRRVLAEQEYDHERGQLQLEEIALLVAEARFERVRAAEVISTGLAAAYDLEDDDFAAQIADLEGIKAERAAWLAERDEDLTSARRDWQSTREALSKLTGGAQGSVWVP